jgi:hypothetical protein
MDMFGLSDREASIAENAQGWGVWSFASANARGMQLSAALNTAHPERISVAVRRLGVANVAVSLFL